MGSREQFNLIMTLAVLVFAVPMGKRLPAAHHLSPAKVPGTQTSGYQ